MALLPGRQDYAEPSEFRPEALLREARRQLRRTAIDVPAVCLLDTDGDVVRLLRQDGRAEPHHGWACYHTALAVFALPDGTPVGVVGNAVGAPFAVLVAEQLFASGCRLLVSITSAGRIATDLPSEPHVVLIDRALRDEGTSTHYLPPARFAAAPDATLIAAAARHLAAAGLPCRVGATWTTDAPYRETATAISAARVAGCLAVEMEAAALYAFAVARERSVVAIAHVTNSMGRNEGDFEKGAASGTALALAALAAVVSASRESMA